MKEKVVKAASPLILIGNSYSCDSFIHSLLILSPVEVIFSQDFSLFITFNVARAALEPILSVQKVLLMNDFSAARITSFFPKTAVIA